MDKKSTGGEIGGGWARRPIWATEALALGVPETDIQAIPALCEHVGFVVVRETWYEAPLNDEWVAAYRLLPQNGAPVVAEVRIFPREPGTKRRRGSWSGEVLGHRARVPAGGLKTDILRQVKVWPPREEVYKRMKEWAAIDPSILPAWGYTAAATARPRRGGRPRARDDLWYAQLAAAYAQASAAGSRQPVADLEKTYGLKRSQIRDAVREARERKLLTGGKDEAKAGRPGGQLTPKARDLLRVTASVTASASVGRPGRSPATKPAASRRRPTGGK